MIIVILIVVQYLQSVVFSFEKILNGQNHSLSDSLSTICKRHCNTQTYLVIYNKIDKQNEKN